MDVDRRLFMRVGSAKVETINCLEADDYHRPLMARATKHVFACYCNTLGVK